MGELRPASALGISGFWRAGEDASEQWPRLRASEHTSEQRPCLWPRRRVLVGQLAPRPADAALRAWDFEEDDASVCVGKRKGKKEKK